MIDLYLVRHGESLANAQGRIAGHTDTPLSEKGMKQAQALKSFLESEKLEIDLVYSSPLQRAYNTIDSYAKNNALSIMTDERLKEIFLGNKEEKLVSELFSDEFHKNPFYYTESGGYESYADCTERVRGFLLEHIFSQKNKKILISSHAGVTRAIIAVLNNLSCEVPFLRIGNASFTHYQIDEITLEAQCKIFSYDMYLREAKVL